MTTRSRWDARKDGKVGLPLAAMNRLIKKAGVERSSPSAEKELAITLEAMGIDLISKAKGIAKRHGRKTIKAKDIKIACKVLKRKATTRKGGLLDSFRDI